MVDVLRRFTLCRSCVLLRKFACDIRFSGSVRYHGSWSYRYRLNQDIQPKSGYTEPSRLPVIHHDQYSCPFPPQHRFKMAKFTKLMEWLLKDNVVIPNQVYRPFFASYDDLIKVHTPDYVRNFLLGTIPERDMKQIGFSWSEGLVRRTRMEVGGTILTARIALECGLACSTGGGTHHAFPSHGSGFCIFNDLAITASYLLDNNLVTRVMIVDLDVHQGDGTASIFQNEPNVFTFSAHSEKNFPLRKQTSNLDLSLECGMDDLEYLTTVCAHLTWLLDMWRPDIVLYDAGVDPHVDDVLGRLKLTDNGLFERDLMVLRMALHRGIPCATVIGGGYDDDIDKLALRHSIIHRAATKVWSDKSP